MRNEQESKVMTRDGGLSEDDGTLFDADDDSIWIEQICP